jgi:tRNA threonylcarbamoyladenosine biosynthesis protein TsaE
MFTFSFQLNGFEETQQFGRKVGEGARPGEVWSLSGPLGAGKTTFVQGFAKGLGYEGRVTSPTFGLQNVYDARLPLYHFDWYRLGQATEVLDLGWEEWLSREGVVVVEWADKFPELFPPHVLKMEFEVPSDDMRRFVLSVFDDKAKERAQEILQCWPL